MTRASILAEALRLPVEERAKLITELIATVESASDRRRRPSSIKHVIGTRVEWLISSALEFA